MIEKVWTVMKIQLSSEPQLMINRLLDQMIMCAIYGVCKVQPKLQIQFNQIINKYSEKFKSSKAILSVYMQVFIKDDNRKDIIHFYNDVYIKTMKEHIISMKPSPPSGGAISPTANNGSLVSRTPVIGRQSALTPMIVKPQIQMLCPNLSLNESLPPMSMKYNTIYSQTNSRGTRGPTTPMIYSGLASPLVTMTPRTQQLYAIGESSSSELGKVRDIFRLGGRVQSSTGPAAVTQGSQGLKT